MIETDFRIKTKSTEYRFERSSEKLQINLAAYPDKNIKITLCFPSENYEFASQEREFTVTRLIV